MDEDPPWRRGEGVLRSEVLLVEAGEVMVDGIVALVILSLMLLLSLSSESESELELES